MNFADLIPLAYENAKAKGFWDRERPIAEFVGLIISELGEAFEEYRSGSREGYVDANGKPQGLPSELADAVIFLADMCGGHGLEVSREISKRVGDQDWEAFPAEFCICARFATELFYEERSPSAMAIIASDLVAHLNALARVSGVDLVVSIEQKMAYNATRSARHGGKRL